MTQKPWLEIETDDQDEIRQHAAEHIADITDKSSYDKPMWKLHENISKQQE